MTSPLPISFAIAAYLTSPHSDVWIDCQVPTTIMPTVSSLYLLTWSSPAKHCPAIQSALFPSSLRGSVQTIVFLALYCKATNLGYDYGTRNQDRCISILVEIKWTKWCCSWCAWGSWGCAWGRRSREEGIVEEQAKPEGASLPGQSAEEPPTDPEEADRSACHSCAKGCQDNCSFTPGGSDQEGPSRSGTAPTDCSESHQGEQSY